MSTLLAIAIVLLVVVAGIAWFQRRAIRDLTARSPRPPADTPARQVLSTPAPTPATLRVSDPAVGDLSSDGIEPHLTSADDAVDDEEIPAALPNRTDAILGPIAWNGDGGWCNLEPFELGDTRVRVLLVAGPEGPGDEHEAWLAAVVAGGDALALEARTLAASSSGEAVSPDDVRVTIVVMGGDEHERFIGGFTCSLPDRGAPCYVWSRDRWATLSLERG